MKLDQLGLTPTGKEATKKLTRQVQKASVAAAMEPKLKLGVLGIEIGQEQSTGITSRVNESVETPRGLLLAAAEEFLPAYKKVLSRMPDAPIAIGVKLMQEFGENEEDEGISAFNTMVHSLWRYKPGLAGNLSDYSTFVSLPGSIAEALKLALEAQQKYSELEKVVKQHGDQLARELDDALTVVQLLQEIQAYASGVGDVEPFKEKMAAAICRKLRIYHEA